MTRLELEVPVPQNLHKAHCKAQDLGIMIMTAPRLPMRCVLCFLVVCARGGGALGWRRCDGGVEWRHVDRRGAVGRQQPAVERKTS